MSTPARRITGTRRIERRHLRDAAATDRPRMNELSPLLAFALTCVIIEITPGPNMTYLAALSLSQGRRVGFSAVAGIALGLMTYGVTAALGLAALIDFPAALWPVAMGWRPLPALAGVGELDERR